MFAKNILVRSAGRVRRAVALGLSYVLILSSTIVPAFTQTGPQPGVKDPLGNPGRYNMFPSHDLMAFIPEGDMTHLTPYSFDTSLNLNALAYEYPQPYQADSNQLVGASGRILTPDKAQAVYARRSGSDVAVTFYGPGSVQPSTTLPGLADRIKRPDQGHGAFEAADFMDIAAADLDKVPDASGNNHDEVIVAYAGTGQNNQLSVNLAVLDYTSDKLDSYPAPVATTTAVLSHTINADRFSSSPNEGNGPYVLPVDNVLAVASGDFDGDGQNEIAVLHIQDGPTSWLTTFRYTNDGQGHRTLKEVSSVANNPRALDLSFGASVDLAAGDFNGDGKDELIVNNLQWGVAQYDYGPMVYTETDFAAVQSDANLNLTYVGRYIFNKLDANGQGVAIPWGNFQQYPRVQLVGGLFKFDPQNDPSLNRRQFAIAWNPPANAFVAGPGLNEIAVATFDVSNDLKTISPLANTFLMNTGDNSPPQQRFSIAAGNFRGNGNIQDPLWSLAVLTWANNGNVDLSMLFVSPTAIALGQKYNFGSTTVDPFARMPVVAADLEGKSVYLGAPVHMMIEGMINTDFVLQEPPKHAFYDNDPASPTYGQIVNVSRQNKFNVSLLTSTKQTFSATSKDSSSWNIGGSVEASAGETVGFNGAITSAKVSVDVTAKVGYDYNRNKDSYNSNYSETTITQTEATDNDDKIIGKLQTFDVWRYRVYGVSVTDSQDQPANGFYEVVLPGPVIPFDAGGRDEDWYQPVYENGNLLSYPQATAQSFTPSDLGSYRVPCPSASDAACIPCKLASDPSCTLIGGKSLTKVVTAPLVSSRKINFDGTSGTLAYDYQNTISSGGSIGYSHTLAESADVKVAYSAKLFISQTRASVDVGVHNSNSWGNTQTSDTSTTSETGITINRVSGDSNQAYAFYPVFYNAQDGTVKVSHAVGIFDGGAREFWAGLYGRKADPALNLPRRFSPVDDGNGDTDWVPTTGSLRKKMRGLFFRKAELNPVTNDYDYLAESVLASDPSSETPAGEKVRIEARVYNYSTAVAASNIKVRFDVIGYNADSDTEIPLASCPQGTTPVAGGRCTVGTANVTLAPLGMQVVPVVWDTTGFGPANTGESAEYRVYVVLDPDNAIAETYETEDPKTTYPCNVQTGPSNIQPCAPSLPPGVDPGQNNEGYGYITLQHQGLSQTPNAALDADVSLRGDALAAVGVRGRIRPDHIPAQINRPLALRVRVHSDRTHRQFSHLLVYDAHPEKGGKVIAAKLVHSGDTKGASVWFDWIPTRLGRQELYAKVVEKFDDPKKGNNVDTIRVNIVPVDNTPPQLAVTLTPSVLWPANGRMVPVVATVAVKDDHDWRPEISLEAITHNEGNDASGDVSGAEFGTDDRQFSLRAAGTGRRREEPRVYEVVYSATDWAGNKTYNTAYVTVPRRR